jgi:hypothetical protein
MNKSFKNQVFKFIKHDTSCEYESISIHEFSMYLREMYQELYFQKMI